MPTVVSSADALILITDHDDLDMGLLEASTTPVLDTRKPPQGRQRRKTLSVGKTALLAVQTDVTHDPRVRRQVDWLISDGWTVDNPRVR
jgi:hypothetical protein